MQILQGCLRALQSGPENQQAMSRGLAVSTSQFLCPKRILHVPDLSRHYREDDREKVGH